MKIVKIAHDRLENKQQKLYLFQTPVTLKRGQLVLTETRLGRQMGYVADDSKVCQDSVVKYVLESEANGAYWPLKRVIGKVELFEEAGNETD